MSDRTADKAKPRFTIGGLPSDQAAIIERTLDPEEMQAMLKRQAKETNAFAADAERRLIAAGLPRDAAAQMRAQISMNHIAGWLNVSSSTAPESVAIAIMTRILYMALEQRRLAPSGVFGPALDLAGMTPQGRS